MGKIFKIAFEDIDEDNDFNNIISNLKDHDLLHVNKDLHSIISLDVKNLVGMEDNFHNQLNASIESFHSDSLALESVIDTLKEFWDKIVAFIKTIIEKITLFFQNHFSLISRRKKHIIKLINEYDEIEKGFIKYEATENTVTVSDGIWTYVNSEQCKTGGSLLNGIKGLVKETNFILNDYLSTVVKRGEIIETTIKQFKNDTDTDVLGEHFTSDILNKGIKEFEIFLLSNKTISLKKPKIEEGASFQNVIKQIAAIDVDISDTITIPKNNNVVFKNIEISEAKNILSELLTLIEKFETFNKTRYKEILKVGDHIRDDSDHLMKNIKNIFNTNSDNSTEHKQLASIKALVGLNPAYIRWVKNPTVDLIHIGTDCIFHTCSLLEKNVEHYSKRKALNLFSVIGLM